MSDDDSSRKGKGAGKSSSKKKNSVKQPAAALKKESKKRDESPDGSKAARPSKKREESPDPIIKELKHAGKVTKKGTEGTATAARGRDALYDLAESIDSLPQGAGKRECVVAFNRMAKYYDGLIMHYAAKRDALRERDDAIDAAEDELKKKDVAIEGMKAATQAALAARKGCGCKRDPSKPNSWGGKCDGKCGCSRPGMAVKVYCGSHCSCPPEICQNRPPKEVKIEAAASQREGILKERAAKKSAAAKISSSAAAAAKPASQAPDEDEYEDASDYEEPDEEEEDEEPRKPRARSRSPKHVSQSTDDESEEKRDEKPRKPRAHSRSPSAEKGKKKPVSKSTDDEADDENDKGRKKGGKKK